jgi:hypothetical protein
MCDCLILLPRMAIVLFVSLVRLSLFLFPPSLRGLSLSFYSCSVAVCMYHLWCEHTTCCGVTYNIVWPLSGLLGVSSSRGKGSFPFRPWWVLLGRQRAERHPGDPSGTPPGMYPRRVLPTCPAQMGSSSILSWASLVQVGAFSLLLQASSPHASESGGGLEGGWRRLSRALVSSLRSDGPLQARPF